MSVDEDLSLNRDEGMVVNETHTLLLNLVLLPLHHVVASPRTHFFFGNQKVRIIQGEIQK